VHAMHVTTIASAAITLLGVVVVVIWMPGRSAQDTSPELAAVAEPAGEPAARVLAGHPAEVEG